ncbi:unnamed protein product [Nippostrongylus brasiliensis]|uniref:Zinc finger protein n=1 Tax=Nippostrongylus brasiliensis TaxID=27835 RepID=A0A0N4XWZ4_NIPBR|nr:unnamed protein product [Nippostrongylus brasiliensis]
MDPQLAAHSGVFSLILQRMMLEAHAANGAILSNFGHVYPAGKGIAMPLLPLNRNDSKPLDSPPSCQPWRKDSIRAHKRQNLEMKISLLKKRKAQQVAESTVPDVEVKKSDDEDNSRDEGAAEACENSEGSETNPDCIVDVMGDMETGSDQVFKSPHAADVHFKKAHKKPAVRPPTDCDECGKRFASAFQLREHISIQHLKERNFVCEECGQKFGRRGGLRRHVQMVHQNHLHMCPYEGCGHPGYKCSKALTAHIRSVHTNVRPYVCESCGKAFVRRNDLKMHTLTHTSETAFHCECGSKFRRLIYLKKHQRLCAARNGDNPEPIDDSSEVVDDSDDHEL